MTFRGIRVGGLTLLHRDSGGGLILASYHPRASLTWHWSLSLDRRAFEPRWGLCTLATGPLVRQRCLRLGMWTLLLSRQFYHKEAN